MKKIKPPFVFLIILSFAFLLYTPIAFPCAYKYDFEENVIIYDDIESFGFNATCNISIYSQNELIFKDTMNMNGYSYQYNAGKLPQGIYYAGIECLKGNSSFLGECKFKIEESENMNIYAIMFLLQFFCAIGILIYKLFNVTKKAKNCQMLTAILLFSGYFIAWLVGLIVFMANPLTLIYSTLFQLESWLIILNLLFFILEIFYYISSIAEKKLTMAYYANAKKNNY